MGTQAATKTAVGPGTGAGTKTSMGPETSTAPGTTQVVSVWGIPTSQKVRKTQCPLAGIYLTFP